MPTRFSYFSSRRIPLLTACLLIGLSATNLRAQDDDDTVFVPPAWANAAVKKAAEGDWEGALRALDQLAPAHRNSYVVPFLKAKIWGERVVETEASAQIAALKQERRFLLQAKALATGSQNAAIRAEIAADLRTNAEFLLEATNGVGVPGVMAPELPAKTKPRTASRPTGARPPIQAPVKSSPPDKQAPLKLSPLAPRKGYVIGRALFADGRPVPNFKVKVLGFDGQVHIFSGATPILGDGDGKNGRYAVRTVDTVRHTKPVAANVTSVQVQTTINYHGQTYTMHLCPVDGKPDGSGKAQWNANSGPGIVRDFVLKIKGVKPQYRLYNQGENDAPNEPSTFYGAQLTLLLDHAEGGAPRVMDAPKGSKIVVTLVPQGPLLDGSCGQTITRTATIGIAGYYAYLRNIPIGAYSLSATLTTPTGEVWTLRGSTKRENFSATTSVLFPPSSSDIVGGAQTVQFYLVR